MKAERQQQSELSHQLQSAKKTITELQDDIDKLQKRDQQSTARILELEASIARQREEVDAAQQCTRMLRDELTEKDGQLRRVTMSLDAAEKLQQRHMSQVDMYYCFF